MLKFHLERRCPPESEAQRCSYLDPGGEHMEPVAGLRFPRFAFVSVFLIATISLSAQVPDDPITGVVTDQTGAVVPGATVSLAANDGTSETAVSDGQGRYKFRNISPGEYKITAWAAGFSVTDAVSVTAAKGRTVVQNFQLQIAITRQEVQVQASGSVDTEPTNNASALTISDSALESLADDPDELSQDLQALAGPSVGPDGGEIFVDGFSGARLPPKSAIREVRVNQNPFSSEYERPGFGRVEIFTKPGSGAFHGEARFNFNDSAFNSMNPFATDKPDYQRKMIEGTFGGPLGKKASFTVEFERRNIGQYALINTMVLDSNFEIVPYNTSVLNPMVETEVSGRLDYQLSQNHTLVGRYEWEINEQRNAGLDTSSLPSRGYTTNETEHELQLTETAVINPNAINEIRFQYRRSHDTNSAVSADPAVEAMGAFTGGGTAMDLSGLTENRYEFQELLSLAHGRHTTKIGGRVRIISETDLELQNYNGMFTFQSLDAYQITEQGLANGLTDTQIRALGGGASQFSISTGNPAASLTQVDLGLFVQEDWNVRRNLTLSAGLRFEKQTNINDWTDWAPRVGVAWAIPGKASNPLAVLRVGFGLFFDRVRENLVLDTKRLDGVQQKAYLIPNPDFYPNIPPESYLSSFSQDQATRVLGPSIKSPYIQQLSVSLERQFFKNTTVSLTFTDVRGYRSLRSRNTNAPYPGTSVRPDPGAGNIFDYESTGHFRQQQFIVNLNSRLNRRFTLFGYYAFNNAHSDTDGAGTFPSNSYDLAAEYGRAAYDVRHRAMIGGTFYTRFGLAFSPFVVMHTGAPFNITIGGDLNGDGVFNDRPAWATDLSRPSVVQTAWGKFDTQPMAGQTIIPRNLGASPAMFSFNVRVSRSFGFGERKMIADGSGGEMGGGHGGSDSHHGGHDGGQASSGDRKYTLTLAVAARNLFNNVNLDTPIGTLSSPMFGQSTSIHGFGPGAGSANRTIELQARLSF